MNATIPYISLSQVGKEFCLAQFNDERKYFINIMVHLKWIWKDLFLKSIYAVKSKYVEVDFTTNPYSIKIPKDMVRFINISYEDENGSLRSFVYDDTINDVQIPTGPECVVCGCTNDYGDCVSSIVPVTKEVLLLGTIYVETMWQKINDSGDLVEVRQVPVIDYPPGAEPVVIMLIKERRVASLEIKTCGCVRKTPANKNVLQRCCGILLQDSNVQLLNPTNRQVATRAGRMKVKNGRIWLKGKVDKYMILSYQTNGSCPEEEIMVPDHSVSSLIFGTDWRMTALAPNKGPQITTQKRIAYDREVEQMDEFLNPVRAEEFLDAQMHIPLWGEGPVVSQEWCDDANISIMCESDVMARLKENEANELKTPEPMAVSTTITGNQGELIKIDGESSKEVLYTLTRQKRFGPFPETQCWILNDKTDPNDPDTYYLSAQQPNIDGTPESFTKLVWIFGAPVIGFIILK